jgi:hypothetical protein
MELNDEWFNVLINTPSDHLKNVCFTNKKTISICSDKQFWYEKFDGLPIINPGNSINQWIIEYKRIVEANNTADDLLYIAKKYYNKFGEGIEINFKFDPTDNLDDIITEEIVDNLIYSGPSSDDRENVQKIIISFDLYSPMENHIKHDMAYLYLQNGEYTYNAWDQNLSLNEIKNILIKIFYYYPDIIPYDSFHRSYFYPFSKNNRKNSHPIQNNLF